MAVESTHLISPLKPDRPTVTIDTDWKVNWRPELIVSFRSERAQPSAVMRYQSRRALLEPDLDPDFIRFQTLNFEF